MTVDAISVFSGAGGMDEGLRRAGVRHVCFAESDPYRRAVLAERFPGVPVFGDVRDVGVREPRGERRRGDEPQPREGRPRRVWPVRGGDARASLGPDATDRVDLLCGGFPCQDLSVAGKRAGLAGERSGLFFEFARIAELVRPRWLLVENVPGLLSSNGGRDFGVVLGTLADLGYGLAWRILNSRFFGVPQRRRRVFIVGAVADGDPRAAGERAAQILAVGSRCGGHPPAGAEAGPDVAYALADGSGSRTGSGRDGQDTHVVTPHYYVEDHEDGPLRANGAGGPPRTDKQPLLVGSVAAPLSHGANPNSNMAGRRREDDENLVTFFTTQPDDQAGGRGAIKVTEIDTAPALDTVADARKSERGVRVADGATVRRLTPLECERLQGLPDGWTDIEWNGKPAVDARRYAALGDAVTANVAEWIGRRIVAA